MKLQVNPNRMELIRLKRRLVFAHRGHKLLKDKQEQMMMNFLKLVGEVGNLRLTVEKNLSQIYKLYINANMTASKEFIEFILRSVSNKELKTQVEPLMNLRIPKFSISPAEYKILPYVSMDLSLALKLFSGLFVSLVKLSEKEKAVELTAYELQKTRRRVNALEYVLIPSLKETTKFISDKLNELERENITRLMKIKEIIIKK